MSQEVELNIPLTAEERLAALKPCPFCGGNASFERHGSALQSCIIRCDECGASLETGEVWNEGARWNERREIAGELEGQINAANAVLPAVGSWMKVNGYPTEHAEKIEDLLDTIKWSSTSDLRAELTRLRELNAALTGKLSRQAEQFDAQHGTPCEQIRHAQEVEAMQADIARKDEALRDALFCLELTEKRDNPTWDGRASPASAIGKARAALHPLAPGSKGACEHCGGTGIRKYEIIRGREPLERACDACAAPGSKGHAGHCSKAVGADRVEREAQCKEPWHMDDGVPYCDECGLFRDTVARQSARLKRTFKALSSKGDAS